MISRYNHVPRVISRGQRQKPIKIEQNRNFTKEPEIIFDIAGISDKIIFETAGISDP